MEAFLNTLINISNYDYSDILFAWKAIIFPACVALVWGIVYALVKTNKIHEEARLALLHGSKEQSIFSAPEHSGENSKKWSEIAAKAQSLDENERKFAVIAADTLCEKILALAGYEGENLGERLKKIESSDLDSLNEIWEAHKIRNRIAHEADYHLSAQDTHYAISRFEKALRELEYI